MMGRVDTTRWVSVGKMLVCDSCSEQHGLLESEQVSTSTSVQVTPSLAGSSSEEAKYGGESTINMSEPQLRNLLQKFLEDGVKGPTATLTATPSLPQPTNTTSMTTNAASAETSVTHRMLNLLLDAQVEDGCR